jgi:hypothetical protein
MIRAAPKARFRVAMRRRAGTTPGIRKFKVDGEFENTDYGYYFEGLAHVDVMEDSSDVDSSVGSMAWFLLPLNLLYHQGNTFFVRYDTSFAPESRVAKTFFLELMRGILVLSLDFDLYRCF